MPFIDDDAPKKPQKVKMLKMDNDHVLFWTAPKGKGWDDEAYKYVVYRFNEQEKVNLADPSKIVTVTQQTFLKLPYRDGKTRFVYVVTALDRMSNESAGVVKKVKL